MDIMNQPETKPKDRNHITIENACDYDVTRMFHLNFYIQPLQGQIQLDDLYRIVSDRLKVLKLVFQVARKNPGRPSKQCKMLLLDELRKHHLDDYVSLIIEAGFKGNNDNYKRMRKNDHISHFVLKMVFAFDEDKKKWFFQQEVRLFKWRLASLDEGSIMTFKCTSNLPFDAIPETEQNEIQRYLDMCNFSTPRGSHTPHFKVQYTRVLDLIKKRRVFLKNGNAFVPVPKMLTLFATEFKDILRRSFPHARQVATSLSNDERFCHIFRTLPNYVQISNFEWDKCRNVHSKDLDNISKESYPLCMKVLHDSLRSKHHLTNGGRVQYTLFLKGIGLPLADALTFWRGELLQVIAEKTFKREHVYCIRHLYGKEGKRKDYTPFGCKKILESTVGSRDNHGCPYKVMSASMLTKKLQECGLCDEGVQDIVKLSQESRYQTACSRYFDITHGSSTNTQTEHPNTYFSESIQLRKYCLRP